MQSLPTLVVTSIAAPNACLRALAEGSVAHGYELMVVGDTKSPKDFELAGCRFYGMDEQLQLDLKFAKLCPTRHYARKNIGYLLAMRNRAPQILETDDDNMPGENFWLSRQRQVEAPVLKNAGWTNVYRYYSDTDIWPRGLPLDRVTAPVPPFEGLPVESADCPIQQGLADENPDVDAIYRLLRPLPQSFRAGRTIALADGTWCPFNSQNTAWLPEAYALTYLPAYCSFRMTDIWRSFVAQKIAWVNGWSILFHSPTVVQDRNEHDLMRDFEDEIPGYVNNTAICAELDKLDLKAGQESMGGNLRACYRRLVEMKLVGEQELELLDAWLEDARSLGYA